MSYDELIKKFEKEEEEEKTKAELDVKPVLRRLSKQGIKAVAVDYDGYGDDGSIVSIGFIKKNSEKAERVNIDSLPESILIPLENYVFSRLPSGWETDAGSCGTVTVDTETGKCKIKHRKRIETLITEEF